MTNGVRGYFMPGTGFFDIASSQDGQIYRIFLSVPAAPAPSSGWPLLILTDGNATFPFAAASLATQAPYPTATNTGWGVLAAIGYPGDDFYDGVRRSWNLTPPPGRSYPPYTADGAPLITGGAANFLSFIETDLLPQIAAKVSVDPDRRALFGHSFGGLFTLYALFMRPALFGKWIAASPSIYWEDGEILKVEAQRDITPGKTSFLHLSAGGYEGDDLAPFLLEKDDTADRLDKRKTTLTIELAEQLAQRLDGAPGGLRARFELFAGETHMSVLPAAVNRAVGIAFAIVDEQEDRADSGLQD
jgi:predicted alpha/beta superfamily hydrolase